MSRHPHRGLRGRLAPLLLAVAVAGTVLAVPALPAAADACDGVWVVVDGSELGAGVQTRCAPGDPSSGLDALEDAGFTYTFVPRYEGMVCTIDGRPDPCNGAPPSAYWSYWNAEPGGEWRYSSAGAGSRDPEPGDVEGWAFGAGDPPSQSPPPAPKEPADDEDASTDGGSKDGSDGSGDDGDNVSPQPSDDGTSGGTAPSDDPSTTSTPSGETNEASPSSDPDASSADGEAGTNPSDEDAEAEDQQTDGEDAPSDEASTDDAPPDDDGADDRERTDPAQRSSDDPADPDDAVAVDAGGGGGAGLVGVGVGATLVAAIAGAAVLRARRSPGLDVDA